MNDNERYKGDLKRAWRDSRLDFWSVIAGIIPVLAIAALVINKEYLYAIIPGAVLALLIAGQIRIKKRQEREKRENEKHYSFRLSRSYDYEYLLARLAEDFGFLYEHTEEAAIFRRGGDYTTRIFLTKLPVFSKKEWNKRKSASNQKANKLWNIKQTGTITEGTKRIRINCAVVDGVNDELLRMLDTNAEQLLYRVEIIVNVAVAGDRLLVPPIHGARLDFHEIRRYEAVVEYLRSL